MIKSFIILLVFVHVISHQFYLYKMTRSSEKEQILQHHETNIGLLAIALAILETTR